MADHLLLGVSRFLLPIPRFVWRRQVRGDAQLNFMSAEHHRVRDFVVTQIPQAGKPLSPDSIARALELPPDRLGTILDDLETHLTFLFRNPQGEVEWAYPVTAASTPHHMVFSSGERIDAA